MQIIKLGALTALGIALGMPAMAQSDQGMWQGQGQSRGQFGSNQAYNGPNYSGQNGYNQGGNPSGSWNSNGFTLNRPNGNDSGQSGPFQGSGYGPRAYNGPFNGPPGNFGPNAYGQGGSGRQAGWSNRQAAAEEVHGLRMALEQAGYSDIRILPQSFLVQARDHDGRPVTMLISPRGFEAVTALTPGPQRPVTGGAP